MKKLALISMVSLITFGCGGDSGTGSSEGISLNIQFVDTSQNLSAQQIPPDVASIWVVVCNYTQRQDFIDCIKSEVLEGSSTTITGLTDGDEYTIFAVAYAQGDIPVFLGGGTVTIQPGNNQVNLNLFRLPPYDTWKQHYYWDTASFCNLTGGTCDFYVNGYLYNLGIFTVEDVSLRINSPTGTYSIVSEADDNGRAVNPGEFVPVPDDGRHFDFSAGDHRRKIRLSGFSITDVSQIDTTLYITLRDPFGNRFHVVDWVEPNYNYMDVNVSQYTPSTADFIFDETRDETVTYDPTTGWEFPVIVDSTNIPLANPTHMALCFENSSNPVDFNNLSTSLDLFRHLYFERAPQILCDSVKTFSSSIWVLRMDPENLTDLGFDQIRLIVIDGGSGEWTVSNPLRLSY